MRTTKTRILLFATGIALFAGVAGLIFLLKSKDPIYELKSVIFYRSYHRYDALIREISAQYGVDPDLVRAVIWRESRFNPDIQGRHGERGLMQVMENTAKEWARTEKIPDFQPQSLFDPATNIRVGAWRLAKSLRHWAEISDDPVPFAVAEYNAGHSRVLRWTSDPPAGDRTTSAEVMKSRMDFPATKAYVNTVLQRYAYYKACGPASQASPTP